MTRPAIQRNRRETRRTIIAFRNRLGLTQEGFAMAVGVTFSTVSRWENGRTGLSRLAWKAVEALATREGV